MYRIYFRKVYQVFAVFHIINIGEFPSTELYNITKHQQDYFLVKRITNIKV